MAEESYKVSLNVYDLSQGLARQMSATLLGKVIEGIWHTGVVVYGNEYYFGGGIQHAPVGTTPYGTPVRVVDLGVTHVPKDVFEMYLQEISPRYTAETYKLLSHNCNNFSNEVAQFLVGATIPDYILKLPDEVLSSPMGALMLPMIQQLESTLRVGAVPQAPQFQPAAVAPVSSVRDGAGKTSVNGSATATGANNKDIRSKSTSGEQSHSGEQEKVPPAVSVKAPTTDGKSSGNVVTGDPLGDARGKVQEEITREFAAIMASGTLRASEAAALATKRVMQRYGHANVAQS